MKNDNVKKESIGCGVEIFTSDQHSFTTDAILLADFCKIKRNDKAADLGSGCGIIPLLWARYERNAKTTAVEIQPNGAELIKKSVVHNSLDDKIEVLNCDLREIEKHTDELYTYSLVSMNPPYKPLNSGLRSSDESHEMARHMLTCTTKDILKCADKLLKFGGRLCICQKPEMITEILCEMRSANFEPKRLKFVSSKPGKAAWLMLIEARKGANKGLKIEPELCTRNSDGSWSEEMLNIYGDYGKS